MLAMLVAVSQIAQGVMPASAELDAAREWTAAHFAGTPKASCSFLYDGKPSQDVMAAWPVVRHAKRLDEFRTQVCATWKDPATGLEVECEGVVFKGFPAVEWVVHLRNDGTSDTPILSDIQALDAAFPAPGGDPILHYARGAVCSYDDFQPLARTMNPGARVSLQPGGGRSSSDFLPFFNMHFADQTGFVIGIGWSGEWAATFERGPQKDTRVRAGMALTRLKLLPGESIRTPRMLLLFYQGDRVRGQNLLRQFILRYHRPQAGGKPVDMPIFNGNWGGTHAAAHLENIQAIIDHDLPVEYYWIDAEWFGTGKWHQTAGDWRVKKDLYPDGFKPLSDRLHQSGRKLLLWFEPERVCEGTPWYIEHDAWLLGLPKEKRAYNWGASQADPEWVVWESKRNQIKDGDKLFNFGIPEARRFLTDFFSDRIDEFGLDCFRHDANIAPLEFWRAADAPDRQGITEIRWVEGLYEFWDELLRRHPNLIIDNCASGGRRIDLETLSRSTPFWRTDFPADAIAKQCHTYGLSSWVPLNATGATNPATDSAYNFRSTFSSGLTFGLFGGGDTPQAKPVPSDFAFDRAKAALQQYRAIQKYFLGEYYPLTQYSKASDAWIAWQFHLSLPDEGMIQAFRRPDSVCETGRVRLQGLDPDAHYSVTDLDKNDAIVWTGKDLMEKGLPLAMMEKPAALILTYKNPDRRRTGQAHVEDILAD